MTDVNPYGFRTAVGGFHKGDVSDYIVKTASAHQAELAELQKALDALRAENETLERQLQQLRLASVVMPAPAETPLEAPAEAPAQEAPAVRESPAFTSLETQELRAYRRAEAAERLARQRAGKLYQDMQSICDASAQQVLAMDAAAQTASDTISQQFQVIRSTLEQMQASVRTSADTLKAMGNLIPDPAEGLEEIE